MERERKEEVYQQVTGDIRATLEPGFAILVAVAKLTPTPSWAKGPDIMSPFNFLLSRAVMFNAVSCQPWASPPSTTR